MSLVSFSEEFGQNSSNQNYQLGWNFINAMQTIQHAVKKNLRRFQWDCFLGWKDEQQKLSNVQFLSIQYVRTVSNISVLLFLFGRNIDTWFMIHIILQNNFYTLWIIEVWIKSTLSFKLKYEYFVLYLKIFSYSKDICTI